MAKSKKFNVGDKVRLTGAFLRSTGQFTGDEPRKVWKVVFVRDGKYGSSDIVAVDEPREDLSYWTKEELDRNPELKFRHIAAGNLQLAGRPDYS